MVHAILGQATRQRGRRAGLGSGRSELLQGHSLTIVLLIFRKSGGERHRTRWVLSSQGLSKCAAAVLPLLLIPLTSSLHLFQRRALILTILILPWTLKVQ